MHLPDDLRRALEKQLAKFPQPLLAAASDELSRQYRSERTNVQKFMTSEVLRLAYLAVRMPATFAAVRAVLSEIKLRVPFLSLGSLCDIGAGPGTATWASLEIFSEISHATLHEIDDDLLTLGVQLMQDSQKKELRQAEWRQTDLNLIEKFEASDLTLLSYVVGELSSEDLSTLLKKAWQATAKIIVIIEPGTPHGFERIRYAREWLIKEGAFLVAPCPHHGTCPMTKNDWCHFSERLERSKMHKNIKDAALGYEDEKFSYIVASKSSCSLPEARILRHPSHHSGHTELVLCAKEGLEKKTISRRQGTLYKQARKSKWGDIWPPE